MIESPNTTSELKKGTSSVPKGSSKLEAENTTEEINAKDPGGNLLPTQTSKLEAENQAEVLPYKKKENKDTPHSIKTDPSFKKADEQYYKEGHMKMDDKHDCDCDMKNYGGHMKACKAYSTKSHDNCECGKHNKTTEQKKEITPTMKTENVETYTKEQVDTLLKAQKIEFKSEIRKEIYDEIGVKTTTTPISTVDAKLKSDAKEGGKTLNEIVDHFARTKKGSPSLMAMEDYLRS